MQQPDQAKKFKEYRSAIKNAHGIDIKDFTNSMKGGRADGKQITKYDLQQLIMGVTVEQEHTTDKLRALEISMDHLEEFPDYYTRLHHMEEIAEKEKEQKKAINVRHMPIPLDTRDDRKAACRIKAGFIPCLLIFVFLVPGKGRALRPDVSRQGC